MGIVFSRSSIAVRITILIVVSQAALYALFSFLIMRASMSVVESGERELFLRVEETIAWSMKSELKAAELTVLPVAMDARVRELFARRERDGLREYLQPLFGRIHERVVSFHFHLPDGTAFLRMHEPARYGDSLLEGRPMIRTALARRDIVAGADVGICGLGLRVLAPLYEGEVFLGLVELGMEFGPAFLGNLKAKQDAEFSMYLFEAGGSASFVAGTREAPLCPVSAEQLAELRDGRAVWSLDCDKARAVGLYPFRNYDGEVIGFINVEFLRIPLADAVLAVRLRLVLLGVALAFFLFLSIVIALRVLLAPLREVVAQTKAISARIMTGDGSQQGTVENQAAEFRSIIGAVNDIIIALRERGALLQAIVEGIPGIVYYVDGEQRVLWANRMAAASVPDLVGMDLRRGGTGFFENEAMLLTDAFSRGGIQCAEACYHDRSGSRVCWEHVAVPVVDGRGQVTNVIRISRDISDKHRAEAELRTLNETLERRVEEEIGRRKAGERMADQQARLAAIGELATGMAHEITQPLNAVSIAVENIRARFDAGGLDAAYMKTKVAAVNADIERVRRVIEHVRLFARGAPDGYRVRFSANRCVENALALIGVQLATHGIDTVVALGDRLPDLSGNPFQYEQVILNLLSNARDAVEERLLAETQADGADILPGRIRIGTAMRDGWLELTVEDNGVGINAEAESRAFDPFFTTKAPGHGTGLGLSISYGIIRKMGGAIFLERAERGALARVRVPAG